MLNPQVAGQRLMEFMTTGSKKAQCERIAQLSAEGRTAALALIGLKPDESPFVTEEGYTNWAKQRQQQEEMARAQKAACAHIDSLASAERETLFATLLPPIAPLLAVWWQRQTDSPALYQRGYVRRPFRLRGDQANTVVAAQIGSLRQTELVHLIDKLSVYQEMPIDWFAAWAPYLGLSLDTLGKLLAVAIDQSDETGDTVFHILRESGRGDHEIGAMGRHVVRGLLTASRADGWEFIEKLLLAAQRQEGLRQSILEVVDEAHPQAFLRMLGVIRENDLYRFSATIRAVDVWFGMNWVAYEKLSVKQANAATEIVETFLRDPAGRADVLASATDGQVIYLALWTMAFHDALAACEAASVLIHDPVLTRRYAALRILGELQLEEARPAIYAALDDVDLRVAQKSFMLGDMYERGTGVISSDTEAKSSESKKESRFERLERNIPRFPAKEKVLEPVIWQWDVLTAHAQALADRLPFALGWLPAERLFPFLALMSGSGRAATVGVLSSLKDMTPERRKILFDFASDTSSHVRHKALEVIARLDLMPEERQTIESLLTRKASDLRKAALGLLIKQSEDATIESGERLLASRDANQRLAGLDLMQQAIARKRAPERAQAAVRNFAASRGSKLTSAETAMLEPMLATTEEEEEKPTLANGLGLMDKSGLTVPPQPVARDRFLYATDSADAIVAGLNAFVEERKERTLGGGAAGASADTLLGNLAHSWQMPQPNLTLSREADALRCPLHDELTRWWESRTNAMRDTDGRELLRVQAAVQAGNIKQGKNAHVNADWASVESLYSKIPQPKPATEGFIAWLTRLYPPSQEEIVDFYLDAAETVCFHLSHRASDTWRKTRKTIAYLSAARAHRNQNPQAWTPEQFTRLWHLLRWLDQPTPGRIERHRMADTDEVVGAFRVGAANADDVYDHLFGPFEDNPHVHSYHYQSGLQTLSSRKSQSLVDQTPRLREILDNCRRRIVEIELRRGETETVASKPALALRYSGGSDVLLKLIGALGKDTFARGYSYYGQNSRANVFSRLIRATAPGTETPASFASAAKAAKIAEQRLIETAVYAPQWASHVEATLAWPGFAEGVWWLHAHTKDTSWTVDKELRESWTTEIADKTPLTADDLTEGAVDVAWFARIHDQLGDSRWQQIADAAKYASSAAGHKRAQMYADAMLGRLDVRELVARIEARRHQDSVRALGLIPLPTPEEGADAVKAEVLRRYQVMQEFLRTSKQFGAMRQESEKTTTRIAMENLARTAGYPDPVRLSWAMESEAVADLQGGQVVTRTVGEVSVTLSVNNLGMPELSILKKGKPLANLPPAVRKDEAVAELVARKTSIARQVSRMRESLETAMCRGDIFSGPELLSLLAHPLLAQPLRSLVFLEAEGKEPVLGYPRTNDDADALYLEDANGATYDLSPETRLRIAHPCDLLQTGVWQQWQRDCFLRERVQPFKQVFRELYVLTAAERAERIKSQRYTGHQINPKQALALFGKRGWIGGGEYDYDSAGPRKTYHEEGYTVGVGFVGWTFSPADVEGSQIEDVWFTRKGKWEPVPLEEVPPRIFSEAMRDLDLVVSVAHVGGVDPEASQSTVEMRAALVREAMGLLRIDNVRFQTNHAIIDGTLATYNVHLGSAVVHRQPGGFLCIVPVHSQHRGRLFLPFVDDDPRTAEVVSKVLLLARDSQIKDPTILEQILATA